MCSRQACAPGGRSLWPASGDAIGTTRGSRAADPRYPPGHRCRSVSAAAARPCRGSRACRRSGVGPRGSWVGAEEALSRLRELVGTVGGERSALRQPVAIADQEFTHDCQIDLKSLAPFREGVVIADLVDQLDVFPDSRTWSFRLRRPLLALPKPDVALIDRELRHVARPVEETLGDYLAMPTLPATPLTPPPADLRELPDHHGPGEVGQRPRASMRRSADGVPSMPLGIRPPLTASTPRCQREFWFLKAP